jgi:integrase
MRRQKGQRIETQNAFFLRYYITVKGNRKQTCVLIAHKSDEHQTWADVEPLIQAELLKVNTQDKFLAGRLGLTDFIETFYLPWVSSNKSAATTDGYRKLWEIYWKPHIGRQALANLRTVDITRVLTKHAVDRKRSSTLGHIKWMLSGVYAYAMSEGIISKNPVPPAKWNVRVARTRKQPEYSLETVLSMLRILEPIDLRAAVAVALAYFAALRPAEIRGLKWTDYEGAELNIQRAVWGSKIGETKNEDSAATVPVIEPLKSLLEKMRSRSAKEWILSTSHRPVSLDSLSRRVITPALEKAGIGWHGYYACRRGISSRVTDTSKNALNSTGLLRHSTPITALKHYTWAQKESIEAAMKQIEQQAAELMAKKEVVQ